MIWPKWVPKGTGRWLGPSRELDPRSIREKNLNQKIVGAKKLFECKNPFSNENIFWRIGILNCERRIWMEIFVKIFFRAPARFDWWMINSPHTYFWNYNTVLCTSRTDLVECVSRCRDWVDGMRVATVLFTWILYSTRYAINMWFSSPILVDYIKHKIISRSDYRLHWCPFHHRHTQRIK